VVIYNGIEAKSDLSKNACKSHEKYTIGMVGTFSRVKGQRYLLYAINYLLEAGLLQRPISVRLVGPVYGGDIFWRDHLTEYIKEHRLGTIVSIEDFIEDIESVYNKLDLFVLSSLREGCSLVALEAISAGVPVISFKNGGAEDVLNHDPECLVECRDYRALALTIIDFMTNDKKAKIISRRQYDRFRNNFTHDIYKHNLLNINSLSIQ
jgi:glycosyltransferase involved in cell wall biosynthesis